MSHSHIGTSSFAVGPKEINCLANFDAYHDTVDSRLLSKHKKMSEPVSDIADSISVGHRLSPLRGRQARGV